LTAANEKGCQTDRIVLTTRFSDLEDPERSLTIEHVNEQIYADWTAWVWLSPSKQWLKGH